MSASFFFELSPVVRENFNVAIKSIITNKLRSVLTILIITIGITSLVGVLTATDALKHEVFANFEKMGTTSFSISSRRLSSQSAQQMRIRNPRSISYFQAETFKKEFDVPSVVSVFTYITNITAKYGSNTTNPTVYAVAADENYLKYKNTSVSRGRYFTGSDIDASAFVCVIGMGAVKALFNNNEDPLGKVLSLGGIRYEVIGVTAGMGGSYGRSVDNEIIVPISNARSYFMSAGTSFNIGIVPMIYSGNAANSAKNGKTNDVSGNAEEARNSEDDVYASVSDVYGRAEQLFRSIRRLSPIDETDFTVNKSDAMIEELTEIMNVITIAAAIIGLITLLGAAVALMNIMLVSVKERTREIGTRKAIGASALRIKQQFLWESVVISQAGCLLGILFGILIGNATAMLMGASFVIPWIWMLFAVAVCLVVGIASGYIPAVRAASLDPIEALRYE